MTTLPSGPSAGADTGTTVVRMAGIDKSFLGVQVLFGVDLDLRAGEVHALVGENGAGKSTLMKILAGVHQADGGTVELDGHAVSFEHPLQAQHAGVSTVFQEFNLLPERTVAENVFLGREPRRRGLVDAAQMNAATAALLEDLGLTWLSPQTRVRSLSVAGQQIVEIVKALSHDARIISMDEPTAALADEEVEVLYRLIGTLRERGVAVLYVSHRLKEIFDLSDRVTILKDGALVDTVDTARITSDELVKLMVGRPISSFFPDKIEGTAIGETRLRLDGCGNAQLDGIDLELRAGEITALAGLQGSGRTEIAHALFGVDRFTRGSMWIDGRRVRVRSPRQAVRAGIALVTEDRKAEGLALNQSVMANARLVLDAVQPGQAGRRVQNIPGILSSLDLVARDVDQEVRFLSGGNQQKVVLAKWLATEPSVMVLDEPTRGIDVGAKQRVYSLMRELSARGVAILMISSELPEVIGMADRIVVLRDGRIAGELSAGADEESVMSLATGHAMGGEQ
ncbi:sugar ABC transporter ATP-binding protein [Actinobacteria bacterium YIM 96077]|uniref:Sugar ABC transporter ATP-binding protein n=1 Tax=Phytoactinopolyspora halophila TaxID=1981511 RepID=A0A329QCE5_9ACTN|nr:sugar ABC transporter ATP-binding protein [Phytoactinopolyspora halophila]AYY14130.1 sugar ABC transporter ATP-binding protein [Actinobacteria bacterium YIM 96077]RAW09994.1 sugar ABC transporter ATP-binding protein [Phytoactinopolyspora halophila]